MRKIVQLRTFQLALIIIIAALSGYFIGTHKINLALKHYKPIIGVTSKDPPPGQTLDMSMFYQVLDRVNQDYYDRSKVDTTKMMEGAINGMLATLNDPYTSFFPPQRNTDFKTQLAGQFSGIGAELSQNTDSKIVVVAPLDSSPAQKAGILAGDIVTKVDGVDTTGWTVAQAVDKIRGLKGTPVTLSVTHFKTKKTADIRIVRDTIVIKSVTGWIKNYSCNGSSCEEGASGKPVAYIRLSQFGDNTDSEWTTVVNNIKKNALNKSNFAGVVLDVRNNPGGYLNDAVFIASEFIKSGAVVIQEDASGAQDPLFVSRSGSLTNIPVVVLINRGSASASEITAGALRDHGRAKLVGEVSFGKGTVQQAVDLANGASVHVSIAKWLTPNGTWVHHKGLTPDVSVAFDASASSKLIGKGLDNQLQAAIQELLK